jgi:biopolymer transport protein ExbD
VLEVLAGTLPRYRLNGTEGPLADVRGRLQSAFANRALKDRVLFLRADRELPYSEVAFAAGIGRQSGASAIALTTQTEAAKK